MSPMFLPLCLVCMYVSWHAAEETKLSFSLAHLSTPLVTLSIDLPVLKKLLSYLKQDFIDDL